MSLATNKFLPLLLLFTGKLLFSQVSFTNYSKDNGLTSNYILDALADSKGVLWLGTANGVSVHTANGWVEIKSITNKDRYNKYIGRVENIFETANGDIWVVAEKGFFLFNGEHWTFFDDNENKGFHLVDIFEDERGWVWVLYEKHQATKDLSILGFSIVEGIVQMFNGERWLKFTGAIGGSAAIRLGDKKIYFTSHTEDDKGNLWITNMDGLYRFNVSTGWTQFDEVELPTDKCNYVLTDDNDQVWVATRNGVATYIDSVWIKYERLKGLKGYNSVKLFKDGDGIIWSMSRKDNFFKTLCKFEDGKLKPFMKDKLKLKGDIDDIIFNGKEIIAYSNKGVSLFDGKTWNNLTDANKIEDGGFSNFTLFNGNQYVFTGRTGLYKLENQELTTLFKSDETWKVTSLKVLDGFIYVGTERAGLFVYKNGETVNYNSANGLADDFIKEIIIEVVGEVWLVTKSGITLVINN